jgi:hypothetical protein
LPVQADRVALLTSLCQALPVEIQLLSVLGQPLMKNLAFHTVDFPPLKREPALLGRYESLLLVDLPLLDANLLVLGPHPFLLLQQKPALHLETSQGRLPLLGRRKRRRPPRLDDAPSLVPDNSILSQPALVLLQHQAVLIVDRLVGGLELHTLILQGRFLGGETLLGSKHRSDRPDRADSVQGSRGRVRGGRLRFVEYELSLELPSNTFAHDLARTHVATRSDLLPGVSRCRASVVDRPRCDQPKGVGARPL